ncbi:MAG: hypothetical protein C0476_12025, partial [Sphingomonas sp.]|nr:hypothetical protein [Sphingomonas sp.]
MQQYSGTKAVVQEIAMFVHSHRQALTLIATVAALGAATPAMAGDCPAGKAGTNPLAGAATAPKGVTDDVVGSINLGTELKFDGHDLRTRRLVVQPGGIVPLHSHTGRPALILTASGTITEYRSSCT